MSNPELPKRRVIDEMKKKAFEEKVNALPDYTMEHFAISPGNAEYEPSYVCVMKLKSEVGEDFSGAEDLMELPISKLSPDGHIGSPLIEKATAEGWRIIAIYKGTKDTPSTAIVVRKRKEEN